MVDYDEQIKVAKNSEKYIKLKEWTHPTGIGKTKNGKKLHILLTIEGQKRLLCRPHGNYELYEITNKSFEDIDCEECRRCDSLNKHFGWL